MYASRERNQFWFPSFAQAARVNDRSSGAKLISVLPSLRI